MKKLTLILVLLFPWTLSAQSTVPAGTVLPLRLETSLKADRIHAGQQIRSRVMQDIPGTHIRKGTTVLGQVVSFTPARLELRFDTLVTHGQRIALHTDLRALASLLEVEEAQIPEGGPDKGIPAYDYTTRQIGGEEVYRGGGPVARGVIPVAEPTPDGARGQLSSNPPCRASIADNINSQALWLFSTDACGIYGFPNLVIEHARRTNPVGNIVLVPNGSRLNIRSGSGLLLRVQGS
jgi:hypothetical protein